MELPNDLTDKKDLKNMTDIFDKCNNIIITDEMVDVKNWLSEDDLLAIIKSIEKTESENKNELF